MISRTKTSNLAGCLKFLHFSHIEPLLGHLYYCIANNRHFDLCVRVLNFVVQKFEYQLFSSQKILLLLRKINSAVNFRLGIRQKTLGYNSTALRFILKEMSFTEIKDVDI